MIKKHDELLRKNERLKQRIRTENEISNVFIDFAHECFLFCNLVICGDICRVILYCMAFFDLQHNEEYAVTYSQIAIGRWTAFFSATCVFLLAITYFLSTINHLMQSIKIELWSKYLHFCVFTALISCLIFNILTCLS